MSQKAPQRLLKRLGLNRPPHPCGVKEDSLMKNYFMAEENPVTMINELWV